MKIPAIYKFITLTQKWKQNYLFRLLYLFLKTPRSMDGIHFKPEYIHTHLLLCITNCDITVFECTQI